ncbi:hypothetical protein BKA93DRAFT_744540 [Sparassis latifolia]
MDVVCSRCNALHWHAERVASKSTANFSAFTTCCNQGQVRLLVSDPPPEFISNLFTSTDDPQAQEFRENIRQYNAALAFTSLGVQLDNSINAGGRAQPVVRIHGELCHRHGTLLPPDDEAPSYAQLYIYDPQDALDHRMRRNMNLREETMQRLQTILLVSA